MKLTPTAIKKSLNLSSNYYYRIITVMTLSCYDTLKIVYVITIIL